MITMMKKHGVVLAVFCGLATALTSSVYFLTKERIAEQAEMQLQRVFDQLIPTALYDNEMQKDCYIVTNPALGNALPHRLYVGRKGGEPSVLAIETTAPDGYSGPIQLLVAANMQGYVYGVQVLEHKETPGLGDKIERRVSHWIERFTGLTLTSADDTRWAVKKDGGEFDQFTGATITPRAVVNSVKHTVLYLQSTDFSELPRCEVK